MSGRIRLVTAAAVVLAAAALTIPWLSFSNDAELDGGGGEARPTAGSDAEPHTEETGPPPPAFSPWIDRASGEFTVAAWDDRHISEPERAKNPVFNPRWGPFNECLEERGYTVRDDPSQPFSQEDMDQLLSRLNDEYPDRSANLQIASAEDTGGLAAAFLHCADRWLALDSSEFEEHGIERLVPGEIPSE